MSDECVEVACDESGNEGENLTQSGSRVFVHAGVSISIEVADELMRKLRIDLGTRATEIKSKVLLKPDNRDVLEWLVDVPELAGNANIHITDKAYFVVGKIVDLIVEEVLYRAGQDIYSNGLAVHMARLLFVDAPAQLGSDWDVALDQFNTMLRTTVRRGSPATLADFYETISVARSRATGELSDILRLVEAGRGDAAGLIARKAQTAEDYLALDPTFAALATVVRTWHERTGLPVHVVHDETSLLTPQRIQAMKRGLADAAVPEAGLSPVPLVGVTLVDSRTDSRVQVADLLAGATRMMATEVLSGKEEPLAAKLRPLIDPNGLWGDSASWAMIVGSKG